MKNIHISTENMYLFESEHGTDYQRPVLVWQDCKNAEKYQRSTLSVKKKIKVKISERKVETIKIWH